MLKFAELFCGAGGLSLGLQQAGFQSVWAVDYNKDACETYAKNIGDHVICSKVEDVRYDTLEQIDGLAFGFPCNDFSLVGEKKGLDGYFGGLYQEAANALQVCQPSWFIAENVPGLLSNGVHVVMQTFANAGYRLYVHKYDASQHGVPQKRQRVIAIGIKIGLSDAPYIPPMPLPHIITASEALSGMTELLPNHDKPRTSPQVEALLRSIPPGANCWHPDVDEATRPQVKKVRLSCLYRRLHPDEPSPTILAGGGGGTYGYHHSEFRALTNRERARLQGFPDDFVFIGNSSSVRKQIGMAVPPPLMRRIGERLKGVLENQPLSPGPLLSVGMWEPICD